MCKPIKEMLKINDELSLKLDIRYEYAEKYVILGRLDEAARKYEVPHEWYYSKSIYLKFEFFICFVANILSLYVNNEEAYEIEPVADWWELWNEESWKTRIHQASDVYDDRTYNIVNGNILFPFIVGYTYPTAEKQPRTRTLTRRELEELKKRPPIRELSWSQRLLIVHFDIYLFLLYLQYPQYKNDIMRYLKYQPVCTMNSEELYIHNLKQMHKELLKQLNESNYKLSSLTEELKELKNNNSTLESETLLLRDRNSELTHEIEQLTESKKTIESSNIELKKQVEELTAERNRLRAQLEVSEESNRIIKAQLEQLKSQLRGLL